MNHEILQIKALLNHDGSVAEPGWAKQLLPVYDNKDIKASKLRIKEWDYYIVLNDDGYGFSMCYADNRYMGIIGATFFDFVNKEQYDFLVPRVFPMGRMGLSSDSAKGNIRFDNSRCKFVYEIFPGARCLYCNYKKTPFSPAIEAEIVLQQPPMDTMVIVTPWKEDPTAFYYNQKINCMRAEGTVRINAKTYRFSQEKDFGTLDWGRGVWTYDNTWYWGSGNCLVDGKRFGYNIGYGFGDTSAASENMLFYDGVAHKLDKVIFKIPENIMDPWKFISNDKRFEMDFFPEYDNRTHISLGIISQNAHQVFGKIRGTAVLDDGSTLKIQDALVFAERVRNRY